MNIQNRVQKILLSLDHTQEDLLALSDDIWINVDHNNSEALEAGFQFKKQYNEAMLAFTAAAENLRQVVNEYSAGYLPVQTRHVEERIVEPLDTHERHTLDEDFCYMRPLGFTFESQTHLDLTTWRQLYERFLQTLAKLQPDFAEIADHPDITSTRNNVYFSKNPGNLRVALEIIPGVYAEANLSANGIRDYIIRVLEFFGYDKNEVGVYLREDRDAGK